jgi:hypothetical protein
MLSNFFHTASYKYDKMPDTYLYHALPYDRTVNEEQVQPCGCRYIMGYEKPCPDDPSQEGHAAVATTAPCHGISSSNIRGEEATMSSQPPSIAYSLHESLLGMYEDLGIHNHGESNASELECFDSWSPATAHNARQYDLYPMNYDMTTNYNMNADALQLEMGPSSDRYPQP